MKLSDFNKYDETPFNPDVKVRNKGVTSSRVGEVYSQFSGELIADNVSIVVNKSVDRAEFIKLFSSSIGQWFGITGGEIKVFLYLLQNLQMNTGKAFFDLDECKKKTGFTKTWVYSALGGLCKAKFIARSTQTNYYWINHSIAFNGSRLSIKKPE